MKIKVSSQIQIALTISWTHEAHIYSERFVSNPFRLKFSDLKVPVSTDR